MGAWGHSTLLQGARRLLNHCGSGAIITHSVELCEEMDTQYGRMDALAWLMRDAERMDEVAGGGHVVLTEQKTFGVSAGSRVREYGLMVHAPGAGLPERMMNIRAVNQWLDRQEQKAPQTAGA